MQVISRCKFKLDSFKLWLDFWMIGYKLFLGAKTLHPMMLLQKIMRYLDDWMIGYIWVLRGVIDHLKCQLLKKW